MLDGMIAYWHWVQITTRCCGRVSRNGLKLSMFDDDLTLQTQECNSYVDLDATSCSRIHQPALVYSINCMSHARHTAQTLEWLRCRWLRGSAGCATLHLFPPILPFSLRHVYYTSGIANLCAIRVSIFKMDVQVSRGLRAIKAKELALQKQTNRLYTSVGLTLTPIQKQTNRLNSFDL